MYIDHTVVLAIRLHTHCYIPQQCGYKRFRPCNVPDTQMYIPCRSIHLDKLLTRNIAYLLSGLFSFHIVLHKERENKNEKNSSDQAFEETKCISVFGISQIFWLYEREGTNITNLNIRLLQKSPVQLAVQPRQIPSTR